MLNSHFGKHIHRVVGVLLLLSFAISSFLPLSVAAQKANSTVLVMTQNVKTNNAEGARVGTSVLNVLPDAVGFQEVNPLWKAALPDLLPGYVEIAGEARDTSLFSEYNPIYYREATMQLVTSGCFWLSDTPGVSSRFDGAAYYRICTWAVLKHRESGISFLFANTHLESSVVSIQVKQMRVLLAQLVDLQTAYPATGGRMVLLGDFNSRREWDGYRFLTGATSNPITQKEIAEAYMVAETKTGGAYSYPASSPREDLDHIFLTKSTLTCKQYAVVPTNVGSDHLGLTALLDLAVAPAPVEQAPPASSTPSQAPDSSSSSSSATPNPSQTPGGTVDVPSDGAQDQPISSDSQTQELPVEEPDAPETSDAQQSTEEPIPQDAEDAVDAELIMEKAQEPSGSLALVLGGVALGILAIGAGAFFLIRKNKKSTSKDSEKPAE